MRFSFWMITFIVLFLAGLLSPNLSDLVEMFPIFKDWGWLFSVSLFVPFWIFCGFDFMKDKKNIGVILILSILSFCYELMSIKYGFPYGQFEYGEMMGGLKLFGLVPVVLPVIYVAMVLAVFYLFKAWKDWWRAIGVGLFLMFFDIVIDPGLTISGVWMWTSSWLDVSWYGVPVQNFIGWFVTGSLSGYVLYKLSNREVWDNSFGDKFWLWVSPISLSLCYWNGVALQNEFWLSGFLGLILQLSLIVIFWKYNNYKNESLHLSSRGN